MTHYRNSYSGDPRWITARFPSKCAKCGQPINKGERAFYYPNGKQIFAVPCGHAEDNARDFEALAFDEAMYHA